MKNDFLCNQTSILVLNTIIFKNTLTMQTISNVDVVHAMLTMQEKSALISLDLTMIDEESDFKLESKLNGKFSYSKIVMQMDEQGPDEYNCDMYTISLDYQGYLKVQNTNLLFSNVLSWIQYVDVSLMDQLFAVPAVFHFYQVHDLFMHHGVNSIANQIDTNDSTIKSYVLETIQAMTVRHLTNVY